MSDTTARPIPCPRRPVASPRLASPDAVADFEQLYRSLVGPVTGFFARRSADPHAVADLTADTFVQVIISFGGFDRRRGTERSWVFGIARRVYAAHCEADSHQRDKVLRVAGRRELDTDQIEELLERIDAEGAGRRLVNELPHLSEMDRAVIELVDLAGFRASEAAAVLGLSAGAVRMRLMRARSQLRKTADTTPADPINHTHDRSNRHDQLRRSTFR